MAQHSLFSKVNTDSDDDTVCKTSPYTSRNADMYFRDGIRRIDFVLVYKKYDDDPFNLARRMALFNALTEEKIEIEVEDADGRILGFTENVDPDQVTVEPIGFQQVMATPDQAEPMGPQRLHLEGRAPSTAMDRYRLQAKQTDKREYITAASANLVFVKLYAPWVTMAEYAERMYFRKPLCNPFPTSDTDDMHEKPSCCESCCESCCKCLQLDRTVVKRIKKPYTWPFNRKREYLYNIPKIKDELFTSVERARVLDYILRRIKYYPDASSKPDDDDLDDENVTKDGEKGEMNIGITKLINEGVFKAAYALHELTEEMLPFSETRTRRSPTDQDEVVPFEEPQQETVNVEKINNRVLLGRYWVSFKSFTKQQPLDYVRYYFGEAVAFYFAWLGYYTTCLVPISIIGLLVFLLGLVALPSDPIVNDVCETGKDVYMCPLCAKAYCHFWKLSTSCLRTKLTRLFDNEGAVIFGIIMAIWSVCFLEMWKRQQVSLAHRWNVLNLEPIDKPPRPEFLSLIGKGYKTKTNPVSGREEPVIPFWIRKVPVICVSTCTVLLGVIMALGFLMTIIFYKLAVRVLLYQTQNAFAQQIAGIITTITASVINLIIIFILKFIYNRVAIKLTDLECHRTQEDYDNSLIVKLYLLQFVNHNSTVFYIAFFQGTTSALPGSQHLIIQSTGCDQGDCLFELFLQLFIIMVGKQALSFLQETLMPTLMRLIFRLRQQRRQKKELHLSDLQPDVEEPPEPGKVHLLACKADYSLLDPGSRPLFDEYLEMLIQYGFITMFVPAFPLAPLFGLINNLLEIRVDAKKFVYQYRRPIMERVRTIGVWYSILVALSSIAIRTNACIIAFTTQSIDRFVYRSHYSPDHSLNGFYNFTLSTMNASRFEGDHPVPVCRYNDYRNGPDDSQPYEFTLVYYHVLAAKFIFVFVFDMIVVFLTSLISMMIPDVPRKIKEEIYTEKTVTNDIIYYAESSQVKSKPHGLSKLRMKTLDKLFKGKTSLIVKEEVQSQSACPTVLRFTMQS